MDTGTQGTQEIITKMIASMEKMARTEFAETPLSNFPFEVSFPLDDDTPDQAQSLCESLTLGLSKVFDPSLVCVMIEDSQYKVRIDR